jgi:hypothetical protein
MEGEIRDIFKDGISKGFGKLTFLLKINGDYDPYIPITEQLMLKIFDGKKTFLPIKEIEDIGIVFNSEEIRNFGNFWVELANYFDKDIQKKIEEAKLQAEKLKQINETKYPRSNIRIVLDIIEELKEKIGKNIPIEEILNKTKEEGIENLQDILKIMKNEGLIFEAKENVYQMV